MKNNPPLPLVSVLIPAYNAGDYLRSAVKSIINQTYRPLEIIIIDDGSTDNCIKSIEDIQDNRLLILRKENGGKASALNLALGVIKGQFWMIQDADDMSHPERVEKQINALLDNPDLAAVFIGTDLIFKGKKFAPIYPRKNREDCKNEIEALKLPAHDATGMYRTSITKGLLFDNELKIGQGVDYVWRVGEVFPITVLEECLYSHRVNYQSITHKHPGDNYEKINIVIKKACQRRGWDFNKYKVDSPPVLLKKKRGMNSILPYAIESIISLKRRRSYFDAVKTAFICISVHPFDYMFYKPMMYLFIPQNALAYYRNRKNRR
jgi:glycosyltransferase involved in cell wall biosynthesis